MAEFETFLDYKNSEKYKAEVAALTNTMLIAFLDGLLANPEIITPKNIQALRNDLEEGKL